MRIGKGLSPKEIEDNFNRCLRAAIKNGEQPPSEMGFDPPVRAAIGVIALRWPNYFDQDVRKARETWKNQQAGVYDREQEEA